MSPTRISLGDEVVVKSEQRLRLGAAKFPGRRGAVVSRNSCGADDRGGLWYVRLEPTRRAKSRVETFWGDELTRVTNASPALDPDLHPHSEKSSISLNAAAGSC